VRGVRRAFGVLVAAVAVLSFAAATQAAPRPARAPLGSPGAQVALERALGYFAPAQARPSFRRAAQNDPRGATMALRDLAAVFDRLTGADRRLAADILARPTDTGQGNYTAPKADFERSCSATICVHWVTSTRDEPPAGWIDSVHLVMAEVWNEEITALGYKKPKADKPTGGHRGGNPNTKLDIFIQDVGRPSIGVYGYCTTDDPRRSKRRDVSAYCVLDDDYSGSQFPGTNGVDALKVTAAHEFHHASQFAYDWKEDRALMEATATNMEADVYPAIPDNFQYFQFSPLTSPNTVNDGPWWPIDMFDAQFGNQYGDWIFYRFLSEYFGTPGLPHTDRDPSINLQIWQQTAALPGTNNGGKYSVQAIRAAIAARGGGANFRDVFAEFGWANASPEDWYSEGADYPAAGFVNRSANIADDLDQANRSMFHFSNDYVFFAPDATSSFINFNLNFPNTARGSEATILTLNSDGSVSDTAVLLNDSGDAILNDVIFDEALVDGVVLVITNTSTRMKNCGSHSFNETVTFACRGDARDDFLNGGFNYTATVD
jgi:hypothetical protein